MSISLGMSWKPSIVVPNITQRALSNGIIRFPIVQSMTLKIPKYWIFIVLWCQIHNKGLSSLSLLLQSFLLFYDHTLVVAGGHY
jgi:hypothetical protein